jgi:hypothetical protein
MLSPKKSSQLWAGAAQYPEHPVDYRAVQRLSADGTNALEWRQSNQL